MIVKNKYYSLIFTIYIHTFLNFSFVIQHVLYIFIFVPFLSHMYLGEVHIIPSHYIELVAVEYIQPLYTSF